MQVLSPAKINIYLKIFELREDGYHDLESLFHMVSLYDVIMIDATPGHEETHISGNHLVSTKHDIMRRSVDFFRRHTGVSDAVSIEIQKEIPVGAGLGGGSSNAATVLLALNRLTGADLSLEELSAVAAEVGSDVPFFLAGPAAMVSGRGERVEPFTPEKTWKVALVHPGFSVSTAQAFRWFDTAVNAKRATTQMTPASIKQRYLTLPPEEWGFENSFTSVLSERFGQYPLIENALWTAGASFVSISGSGSVMYGVFAGNEISTEPLEKLRGCRWWIKETLARTPYAVLQ